MLLAARRRLSKGCTPNKNRNIARNRSSTSNIRVVVRVRPHKDNDTRTVIKVVDDKMLIFDPKEDDRPFYVGGVKQNNRNMLKKKNKETEFVFDRVFGFSASNQDVFEGSTRELIKSLLDGYNCSVFVYGATGAGKTYTMLGSKMHPGISYLTMVKLYDEMEVMKEEKDFDLSISYLEVYNETVHDLISPSGPLTVRDDGTNGTVVSGIKIHRITNAEELFAMLEKGNKNRTQHPTDANAESSRSHAVFQVIIRIADKLSSQVKIAKLAMIDLAGSERGAATGFRGKRFSEGSNINKSLLALGNCVNALADGLKHIPYRDSKLTRLLKDSLGGNCKTVMIANVSPSSMTYEETYNTLNYATRAKKINTKIRNNVYSVDMHISQYIKLVEELRVRVSTLERQLEEEKASKVLAQPPPSSEVQSTPNTPNVIQQEELIKKWKERLRCFYHEKGLYHKEILKLDMEMKILNWRILLKKMTAKHLSVFHSDGAQGSIRVDESMSRFQRHLVSYKDKLKRARKLQAVHEAKIQAALKQIDEEELMDELKETLDRHDEMLEKQDTALMLEYNEKLMSMQQNEMKSQDKIIHKISKMLEYFHAVLEAYDKLTVNMDADYKQIIHLLSGVKEVTWEDVPSKDTNGFSLLKKVINLSLDGYATPSPEATTSGVNTEELTKVRLPLEVTSPHENVVEDATSQETRHNDYLPVKNVATTEPQNSPCPLLARGAFSIPSTSGLSSLFKTNEGHCSPEHNFTFVVPSTSGLKRCPKTGAYRCDDMENCPTYPKNTFTAQSTSGMLRLSNTEEQKWDNNVEICPSEISNTFIPPISKVSLCLTDADNGRVYIDQKKAFSSDLNDTFAVASTSSVSRCPKTDTNNWDANVKNFPSVLNSTFVTPPSQLQQELPNISNNKQDIEEGNCPVDLNSTFVTPQSQPHQQLPDVCNNEWDIEKGDCTADLNSTFIVPPNSEIPLFDDDDDDDVSQWDINTGVCLSNTPVVPPLKLEFSQLPEIHNVTPQSDVCTSTNQPELNNLNITSAISGEVKSTATTNLPLDIAVDLNSTINASDFESASSNIEQDICLNKVLSSSTCPALEMISSANIDEEQCFDLNLCQYDPNDTLSFYNSCANVETVPLLATAERKCGLVTKNLNSTFVTPPSAALQSIMADKQHQIDVDYQLQHLNGTFILPIVSSATTQGENAEKLASIIGNKCDTSAVFKSQTRVLVDNRNKLLPATQQTRGVPKISPVVSVEKISPVVQVPALKGNSHMLPELKGPSNKENKPVTKPNLTRVVTKIDSGNPRYFTKPQPPKPTNQAMKLGGCKERPRLIGPHPYLRPPTQIRPEVNKIPKTLTPR